MNYANGSSYIEGLRIPLARVPMVGWNAIQQVEIQNKENSIVLRHDSNGQWL